VIRSRFIVGSSLSIRRMNTYRPQGTGRSRLQFPSSIVPQGHLLNCGRMPVTPLRGTLCRSPQSLPWKILDAAPFIAVTSHQTPTPIGSSLCPLLGRAEFPAFNQVIQIIMLLFGFLSIAGQTSWDLALPTPSPVFHSLAIKTLRRTTAYFLIAPYRCPANP
jgi:hypothetical protein